jgi:hypothetical protein
MEEENKEVLREDGRKVFVISRQSIKLAGWIFLVLLLFVGFIAIFDFYAFSQISSVLNLLLLIILIIWMKIKKKF